MTYRDSDALCLPARPPQHAAPVSLLRRRPAGQLGAFGRLRRLTRQAVRLVVTIIAWAAGLGLVIGSIVMVATVTGPRQADQSLGARQDSDSALQRKLQGANVPAPIGPHSGTTSHRSYKVLANFSGSGNQTTRHFTVKARQRWQLRWAYRCAAQDDAGPANAEFKLLRADVAAAGEATLLTATDVFAASGHGSAWFTPGSHQHYLKVVSACSWHVQVVQAV
jgi:hypothetical protein